MWRVAVWPRLMIIAWAQPETLRGLSGRREGPCARGGRGPSSCLSPLRSGANVRFPPAPPVMNLIWIAALAGLVLVEKVVPRGEWIARGVGVALIGWGVVTLTG